MDNPNDSFSNVPTQVATAIAYDLVDYYLPHAPKLEAFSRPYIAQKVLEEVRKPILTSYVPHTEQLAAALYYSLHAQLAAQGGNLPGGFQGGLGTQLPSSFPVVSPALATGGLLPQQPDAAARGPAVAAPPPGLAALPGAAAPTAGWRLGALPAEQLPMLQPGTWQLPLDRAVAGLGVPELAPMAHPRQQPGLGMAPGATLAGLPDVAAWN